MPLYFHALFAAHLLGDFYFQSQDLTADNRDDFCTVFKHCLCYVVSMVIVPLIFCRLSSVKVLACASAAHVIIYLMKLHCWEQLRTYRPKWVFLIDQILHLAALAVLTTYHTDVTLRQFSQWSCPYTTSQLLRFVCLVLFLGKPCNAIMKGFNPKQEACEKQTGSNKSAGAAIGTLERLLTAFLFLLEEYGAIGVVFAAKTLTRYQRITTQEDFSEYYLIGTLGSLLLAISATLFFFPPG